MSLSTHSIYFMRSIRSMQKLIILPLVSLFCLLQWAKIFNPSFSQNNDLLFPAISQNTSYALPAALTFDCSWNDACTSSILDTLDLYSAKATFFISAYWARRYPERIKEILERGHEIGSHSDLHRPLPSFDLDQKAQQLLSAKKSIRDTTGQEVLWFRPPYGIIDQETLRLCRAAGMYCVLWDIDSQDWKNVPPKKIAENIIGSIHPYSILLFQNGALNTVSALEELLPLLSQKGYQFCTISQLMQIH